MTGRGAEHSDMFCPHCGNELSKRDVETKTNPKFIYECTHPICLRKYIFITSLLDITNIEKIPGAIWKEE